MRLPLWWGHTLNCVEMGYSQPAVCTYLEPKQVHLYRWVTSKSILIVKYVYPQWQSLNWYKPQLSPAVSWHYPVKMGKLFIVYICIIVHGYLYIKHLCPLSWPQESKFFCIPTGKYYGSPRPPAYIHTHTHTPNISQEWTAPTIVFSYIKITPHLSQQQPQYCCKTKNSNVYEMDNISSGSYILYIKDSHINESTET